MATKDFRANQIETSKIIGTGSIAGTTVGIAIYSGSIASNREGGTSDSAMFNDVGSDVFLFVSGTISNSDFNRTDATLFGGDVVISGTLYAERQVIEVDSVAGGDFYVTGNMYVEPDANSDSSVVFSQADGTRVLKVNTSSPNVDIDGNLIVTGNIHMQSDNVDGINVNAENNFQIGAQGNIILTIDSDNDDASGSRFLGVRDGGGAYGLVIYDRGDIIFNNNSLSTQDFQVRSDNDFSAIYVDASEDAVAIGRFLNTDFGSQSGVGTDVKILLSGTVGSKDGSDRGVVLAAGDVVISGSLHGGSPLQIGEYQSDLGSDVALFVSGTSGEGGGKGSTNGATVIGNDLIVSGTYRGGYDALAGFETFQAVSEQYLLLSNDNDFGIDQLTALDTNFFVSGSIGSKNSDTVKGTAVFGGDLHVSGAITADGGAPAPTYRYVSINMIPDMLGSAYSTGRTFKVTGDGSFAAASNSETHYCAPGSGSIARVIYSPSHLNASADPSTNHRILTSHNPQFFVRKNDIRDLSTNIHPGMLMHTTASAANMKKNVFTNANGTVTTQVCIFDLENNKPFVSGSNSFDPGDILLFNGIVGGQDVQDMAVTIVLKIDESTVYP